MDKISDNVDDDVLVAENNRRMEFYLAADSKLGQLAAASSVQNNI